MKRLIVFFLLLSSGLIFHSCKKDVDEIKIEEEQVESRKSPFKTFNWSEKEKKFFSLENSISNTVRPRSGEEGIWFYRLVESYNKLAEQNDINHFVEDIYDELGLPIWKDAFIYSNKDIAPNVVAIPLIKEGDNKISGVIVAYKRPEDGRMIFEGMTREELKDIESGVLMQKLGYLNWMIKWEYNLFKTSDFELLEPYCEVREKYENNELPSPSTDPCEGYWLDICFIEGSETYWYGRLNAPPHLDHDHDGIPNSEDQDFLDWGYSQETYEDLFNDWWEDEMQDEYGDYDDFYDDYYDDYGDDYYGGGGFDEDFWNDLEDVWWDIEDWVHDAFQDIGDWFGGIWDDVFGGGGPNCPWDNFTGGGVDDRNYTCDWFWVYDSDCVHEPWWTFSYGMDAVFRYRLSNMWEAEGWQNRIDYACLEQMIQEAGCDPLEATNPANQGFEDCVNSNLENRENALIGVMGYHNVPTWFTLKDFLEATCSCPLDVDFQTCASYALFNEIANRVNADLSGLSNSEKQELFTNVWDFQSAYELDVSSFEMFDIMIGISDANDCINADDFEVCLANQVFRKEGVSLNDPNVIQDLVTLLHECFTIGGNTGPGFTHKITLYVDQPWENSSVIFSPGELVGHSFIGLTQELSNGSTRSQVFGFYPNGLAFPGNPIKPGVFKDDGSANHDYDVSITWEISAGDFNTVINAIESSMGAFSVYNLDENACVDFALMACNSIDLNVTPPLAVWPKIGGAVPPSLIPNFGYSPAKLGQYMRQMPLDADMVRDANGGISDDSFCD